MPTHGKWQCLECDNWNTGTSCAACSEKRPAMAGDTVPARTGLTQCTYVTDGVYRCRLPIVRSTGHRWIWCEWHHYWMEIEGGVPRQSEFQGWIADMDAASCSDYRHYPTDLLWLMAIGSEFPPGVVLPPRAPCLSRSCVILWQQSPVRIAQRLGRPLPANAAEARKHVAMYLNSTARPVREPGEEAPF